MASKKKSDEEYLKEFAQKLKVTESIGKLYKQDVQQESYFEQYAQILLKNDPVKLFDKIEPNSVRTKKSYFMESHDGITKEGNIKGSTFKWEERECIALRNYYIKKHDKADFRILDYQMPLKNTNNDKEDGVDLIGTDGKDLYLLEYKRFISKESLLRSVLEVYTYRQLLENAKNKVCSDYNYPEGKLIPGILVMEGSEQYKSWQSHDSNSSIKKLIHELGISVFLIVPERPFSEDEEMKIKMAKEMPEFDFDLTIKDITKYE